MNKRVSIIIPCYNAESFIGSSIASIYEQEYPDVELIIVDDGSTDNSREMILFWVARFNSKGWTLQYIYQENQGVGSAINTGLKYVSGKYLTLLDADDRFLPNSLKLRANFLEEHSDCSGVRSNGWYVNEEERSLFVVSEVEKRITDLFTALVEGKTNNWAGTYMVRADVLFSFYPDRNIYPSRFGQNFQIILPVAYKRKFGYIDEPLMEYCIQLESHSRTSDPELQYKKSVVNIVGWRDIFYNVINHVVESTEEKNYYLKVYDSVFYRRAMKLAISAAKKSDMRDNYYDLIKTGYASLDDHIVFLNTIHPIVAFPLRCVRKIKSIVLK